MSTRIFVMEGNPGRVSREITVPMEYRRNRSSEDFLRYRNEIMNLMSLDIKK